MEILIIAKLKLKDVEGGVTLADRVDDLVAILIHSTEQNLGELFWILSPLLLSFIKPLCRFISFILTW